MAKEGELAAFTAYAMTFPDNFLALVDTYNTLSSGIPNFLAVSLAMEARRLFQQCEEVFGFPFAGLAIVVSNDLNESTITALNDEGHEADVFGIGTNVVTCQSQPALGVVYKLVELEGKPCMKLSEDVEKTSLPTAKAAYRLYNKAGIPAVDLIQGLWLGVF
ncbi:nicotinate phosphoribosyltransferase, putative [Eimeria brunetti]|uniref:nicotinate phosphoribosyltransferase n=1 Tax=Eimeria brunetti TaxID=51314 RepID=U6LZW3_9EIME|nr:nicotinate phosphoribosyltransferase, putative [Eimeria brunetti]